MELLVQYEQASSAIAEATEQKTILLIEDNYIFSTIITKIITDYTPYRVIQLPEGSQMMQVIGENKPHLLLLDYDLPGMNGIELYDLVHSTEGQEHIPAIMVSANPPLDEMAKRNLPGLRKPFRTRELINAIEEALTVGA
jgi:CheY-like chemotaxis protein